MDLLQYLKSVIGPRPPEIKIPPEYPLRQPLYDTVTIKLDKARSSANPEQRRECFKEIYVEKAEGTAYVRLLDKNAGDLKLKQGLILYSKVDVDKWYLVNDAQADKEIKLVLTKEMDFFLRQKQATRITELIDILEHAKVMYLEADKIKSGNLVANIVISSILKTAESGACIVIDGAAAIPEIKAYNDDPDLSDKTWDEIDKTWDEWEGKWDAQQTLSIKADGSGWIGELVNGKHPISWDTNGKVEIQVAYIKGLIATLIAVGGVWTTKLYVADLIIQIVYFHGKKINTVDDSISTYWQPKPANEPGAWISWDLGISRATIGCEIYWGADAAYRPSDYKIYTSPDNSAWTEQVHETTAPPASAWKEYSWNKVNCQYIKLIVTTHGATGTRVYEVKINIKDEGFLGLADTPNAYAGQGGKIVKVKANETGLEFV